MLFLMKWGLATKDQLLHWEKMRRRAGNNITDTVLQTIFLGRLSINVRQILKFSIVKLGELAEQADKIMDIYGPGATPVTLVYAVGMTQEAIVGVVTGDATGTMAEILKKLDRLTTEVAQLKRRLTA